jgi:hypothetical protein
VQVGNGGFCLRRPQACISLLEEFPETRKRFMDFVQKEMGEDIFFAAAGAQSLNFKIPNERVASTFSLEMLPEWYFKANGGRCAPQGALNALDQRPASNTRRSDQGWHNFAADSPTDPVSCAGSDPKERESHGAGARRH